MIATSHPLTPSDNLIYAFPQKWGNCLPVFDFNRCPQEVSLSEGRGQFDFHPKQLTTDGTKPTGFEILENISQFDRSAINGIQYSGGEFEQLTLPETLAGLLNISGAQQIIENLDTVPTDTRRFFVNKCILLLPDFFWSVRERCFYIPGLFWTEDHEVSLTRCSPGLRYGDRYPILQL